MECKSIALNHYLFLMFQSLADFITFRVLQLEAKTALAESVHFFIYDAVSAHTSGVLSLKSFRKVLESRRQDGLNTSEAIAGTYRWLQALKPLPTLKQMETLMIREALKQAKGNQSIAARFLGITRQTLINKLKKLPEDPGDTQ